MFVLEEGNRVVLEVVKNPAVLLYDVSIAVFRLCGDNEPVRLVSRT
jgi:hypothetical protein